MGSHLCSKSGSVYRKPPRMAALTWDLLSYHMTSQYELYFDIKDKLVPDLQSYSETIYACCSRLNSFAAGVFFCVCGALNEVT